MWGSVNVRPEQKQHHETDRTVSSVRCSFLHSAYGVIHPPCVEYCNLLEIGLVRLVVLGLSEQSPTV